MGMTHELVIDAGDVVEVTRGTQAEISQAYLVECDAAERLGWLAVEFEGDEDEWIQITYQRPDGGHTKVAMAPIDE